MAGARVSVLDLFNMAVYLLRRVSADSKENGLDLVSLSRCFIGAPCATRTRDHLIKSQMLYRLS